MLMHQCARCGAVTTLQAAVCPKCLCSEVKAIALPGQGQLVSWTTIRRAPAGYSVAAPYDVVVVDVGPGVRVTGRLSPQSLPPAMGARVEQVAEDGTCPVFTVRAG